MENSKKLRFFRSYIVFIEKEREILIDHLFKKIPNG